MVVVIRMRGLPFESSAREIRNFFVGLEIKEEDIHLVPNENGKASGVAFAVFREDDDARKAMQRDGRYVGKRYVNLFLSSAQEMQKFLREGVFERGKRGGRRQTNKGKGLNPKGVKIDSVQIRGEEMENNVRISRENRSRSRSPFRSHDHGASQIRPNETETRGIRGASFTSPQMRVREFKETKRGYNEGKKVPLMAALSDYEKDKLEKQILAMEAQKDRNLDLRYLLTSQQSPSSRLPPSSTSTYWEHALDFDKGSRIRSKDDHLRVVEMNENRKTESLVHSAGYDVALEGVRDSYQGKIQDSFPVVITGDSSYSHESFGEIPDQNLGKEKVFTGDSYFFGLDFEHRKERHHQNPPVSVQERHQNPPVSVQERHYQNPPVRVQERHDQISPVRLPERHDQNPPVRVQERHDQNPRVREQKRHYQNPPVRVQERHYQNPPVRVQEQHDRNPPVREQESDYQNPSVIVQERHDSRLQRVDEVYKYQIESMREKDDQSYERFQLGDDKDRKKDKEPSYASNRKSALENKKLKNQDNRSQRHNHRNRMEYSNRSADVKKGDKHQGASQKRIDQRDDKYATEKRFGSYENKRYGATTSRGQDSKHKRYQKVDENDGCRGICINMIGLPYLCTEKDIDKFFQGLKVKYVHRCRNLSGPHMGKTNGEAFVIFNSLEDCSEALERDHQLIQGRFVKVRKSPKEVMYDVIQQEDKVLGKESQSLPDPVSRKDDINEYLNQVQYSQMKSGLTSDMQLTSKVPAFDHNTYQPEPSPVQQATNSGYNIEALSQDIALSQLAQGANVDVNDIKAGCVVGIRNLPSTVTADEVLDFFYGFRIIPDSIRIHYLAPGRSSGDAIVSFSDEKEAMIAMRQLNLKPVGRRNVQLFPI